MITALLYSRVSSEEQASTGLSLDTQLAECRQYAVRMGWAIGKEYTDILSGTRDDRPQYQRLLAHARAQPTGTAVVVAALDRLGRRLLERVRCREELKALGVAVHSVREGGEVSDLVANVLGAVAQEEVRRLGGRVRASRRYMASLGWKPPARAPYGYLWRSATESERQAGAPKVVLDLDERAAPSVAEAFARIADGASLRKVTDWLRELPEQERAGRRLPHTVVAHLLRAPVYVARPDQGDPDVLARPRARWPALVSDEVWARAQRHLADHEKHPHQSTGQYLLVGFFRCPVCGQRPVGNTNPVANIRRYRCASMAHGYARCLWALRVQTLDEPVLRAVLQLLARVQTGLLLRQDEVATVASPVGIAGYRAKRLASLRAELVTTKERLLRATRLYVDGAIERAGYEMIRDDAARQMAAVETEITRLDTTEPASGMGIDEAVASLNNWADILAAATESSTEQKRAILKMLVASIDVTRIPPAPGRVWGRYTTRIIWTPLGEALHSMAGANRVTATAG